jgi:hypothetical protein
MSNPTEALAVGLLVGVCIGFIGCMILAGILSDKKESKQ